MFCSKCGTQNNDDSTFCTKCGAKIITSGGEIHINSRQQSDQADSRGFIKGEPEEIDKKKGVLLSFFLVNALYILFISAALLTKFKFVADLMNSQQYDKDWIATELYDKYSSWGFIALAVITIMIIVTFLQLRMCCIKREFSKRKGQVLSNTFGDISLLIALLIALPIIINSSTNGTTNASLLYYTVAAILLIGQIMFVGLFIKAANAEDYYKFRTSRISEVEAKTDWKCPKCGNQNTAKEVFCQNCGENRPSGKGSAENMWKCKNCGELNPKNNSMCRGCGQYK